MNDTLLLIGILAAWTAALVLMPKMNKDAVKAKFRALDEGEAGTYDPSEDPDRVMRGEGESYFD